MADLSSDRPTIANNADVRFLGSWPTESATGATPPQPDEADRWLIRLREGDPA